ASFAAWGVWVGMGIATLMEWIDEALGARAEARTRETVGAVGGRAPARARPPRREPAHRAAQRRDPGARLRQRRAAVGGSLRARGDGGRQRHISPVVRAGGRWRPQGRERA